MTVDSSATLASPPRTHTERRAAVRYACLLEGQCRPMTALEAGNTWPVQTVDLSAGGAALRLCRRFEPGTLLAVDLCDTAEQPVSMPLARVRYAAPLGPCWLLGCAWVEQLEPTEMVALLGKRHEWEPVL